MDINTFEFIPRINLTPRTRYLDLIWTYRRKRRPDGSLKAYKALLCVNCSRQIQGIDYTESFAPVVQRSTTRMVNTLAAMHNLKGKQIDFTQAFPQAKLKEDIYLRFPAGFEHKNDKWALKLKRNLYGLVQASRNWFLKLSAVYERLGFKQSKSYPCLFLWKDMIIVLYTDECLLYARDTTDIDKFVKTLRDDYKLTHNDPDPIDDFLGISFSHQDNGEIHMIQTGLIDAITESAHIPKGRLKNTPTPATAILHADAEGLARQESWNYPSVIGQLNYHKTHNQTYCSQSTNAHNYQRHLKHCTRKQSNVSYTTYNAQEATHSSQNQIKTFHLTHTTAATSLVLGTIICASPRFMLITYRIHHSPGWRPHTLVQQTPN
jgi:hypothetical protein